MKVNVFKTPFGAVEVLKNGNNISFDIKTVTNDTYWDDNDEALHPEGCYEINLDMLEFNLGDIIICKYNTAILRCDGGGENTLNIVGNVGDYTIGMGCVDTMDLVDAWEYDNKYLTTDMNYTKYPVPYELYCFTKDGFEFRVIDDPKLYRDRAYRKYLTFSIVWERKEKYYAWDIVSFLTC